MKCSPYIARVSARSRSQDAAWLEHFDAIFDELHRSGMDACEAAIKAADRTDEDMAEAEIHRADMAYEDRRIA